MTISDINDKLICILRTKFGVGVNFSTELLKAPLTAPPFSLDAVRLYSFLMCVEEEFDLYFSSSEIQDGDFNSLVGFQTAISEKIRESSGGN